MSELTASKQLPEEILDATMRLFWKRGYFNTSISDLVQVTGFNRAALYKNFGGKHGLFIAMLHRFRSRVVENATAPLDDPASGIEGIKTFFQQFRQQDEYSLSSHGCFLIATASNLPSHDPEVAEVIEEFINHLRSLFQRNLRYMQAEDELNNTVDVEVASDFLVGNVVGLMTLFRANMEDKLLDNHVNGVISFISELPVKKPASRGNLHLIS